MTEDEDIAEGMKDVETIRKCQHRWEEGENKSKPAYRCARCGAWSRARSNT